MSSVITSRPNRYVLVLLAFLSSLMLWAFCTGMAHAASVYEVHVCDPSVGNVNNAFKFSTNEPTESIFSGTSNCGGEAEGDGLQVLTTGIGAGQVTVAV